MLSAIEEIAIKNFKFDPEKTIKRLDELKEIEKMENKRNLVKAYTNKHKENLEKMIEKFKAGMTYCVSTDCHECVFTGDNSTKSIGCANNGNLKGFYFENKPKKELIEFLEKTLIDLGKTDEEKEQEKVKPVTESEMPYNLLYAHLRTFISKAEDFYTNYCTQRFMAYSAVNSMVTIIDKDYDMIVDRFNLKEAEQLKLFVKEFLSDLNTMIECYASDWNVNKEKFVDMLDWRKEVCLKLKDLKII